MINVVKFICLFLLLAGVSACSGGDDKPNTDALSDSDTPSFKESLESIRACRKLIQDGFRPIAKDRADRFLGKVEVNTARCRGGSRALAYLEYDTPWIDWPSYWASGDDSTKNANYEQSWVARLAGDGFDAVHIHPNARGIDGALIDLEYERLELIKFNLFDNATYPSYVQGVGGKSGPTLKVWDEMRLPPSHPVYARVGGDADQQICTGDLIRHRTLTGICNDINNPLMGSTNMLFARNVEFSETFPDLGLTELTRARHGDRLGLLKPDPQVISRKLFTRMQSNADLCKLGQGLDGESKDAHCDYIKAPFFNVLAAFWIQFMTHDWFSHLQEGENGPAPPMSTGCVDAAQTGCRANDKIRPARVVDTEPAPRFQHGNASHLARAHRTFDNTVTAWWDASQIYGYDERSRTRVKRDSADRAKLALVSLQRDSKAGDELGYLPRFAPRCANDANNTACDNIHPAWVNQEATAFPDNWTIGLSFYHNVFSREHNAFVQAFRDQAAQTPEADSGLRNPARPDTAISYAQVKDDELFEAARLVVSAIIAKIHTIEWTTQLLYDEPLYRGMNANWNGLFDGKSERVTRALSKVVNRLRDSDDDKSANSWYSVLAAGPGIFGLGSKRYDGESAFQSHKINKKDIWTLHNNDHINGGINHFGSPFNFPEEFVTVYRLHPLVPDLLELRDQNAPNKIVKKVPALTAFRAGASNILQRDGIADWALSMGRQRLGALTLQNHGQFLQNLSIPHRDSPSVMVDVAALDLIRDRERGVPRFNEFRRQYGLKQLSSFEDFEDKSLPDNSAERKRQKEIVLTLREVYGQHRCDASKIISHAQRDANGNYPNDCLGKNDGDMVDNIEDLDTVVGWLAEPVRPHGYAISETQFVVFILNASRRLFSDRFFTSSYRPEFYTRLGHDWVHNNGPTAMQEKGAPNGHEQPVSPMKRVLMRTIPSLAKELEGVVNVFDPWARDRGDYYSLQWKPRPGAESDAAFQE